MAVVRAESGDLAGSATIFDSVIRTRLHEVFDNELGLSTLCDLARAGARLGDPRTAAVKGPLLTHAGELSWIACYSTGPVDLALAWAAAAEGRRDEARGYLESAAVLCRRAGARPWLERIRTEQERFAAEG